MSDVSQILAKLARTQALVIGDVMLDHYLYGQEVESARKHRSLS